MSKFKLIASLPVGTGACRLAEETAMGFLPDWRSLDAPLLPVPGLAPSALRRVTTAAGHEDMLLRAGEVQYVCRYAARQSHGRPIRRPRPPSLAFSGRLRARNDIMFRGVRAVL